MPALEPLALSPRDAAEFLSISKRSLSGLIAARKIAARKDGPRTLVNVASIRAYYESLPLKPITRRSYSMCGARGGRRESNDQLYDSSEVGRVARGARADQRANCQPARSRHVRHNPGGGLGSSPPPTRSEIWIVIAWGFSLRILGKSYVPNCRPRGRGTALGCSCLDLICHLAGSNFHDTTHFARGGDVTISNRDTVYCNAHEPPSLPDHSILLEQCIHDKDEERGHGCAECECEFHPP
jgi:hypothetical protein